MGHKAAECGVNWIGETAVEEEEKGESNIDSVEVAAEKPWVVASVTEVPEPPVPDFETWRTPRRMRKIQRWWRVFQRKYIVISLKP